MNEALAKPTRLAPAHTKDKLAIWFFLGGEVVLFGTLIFTYAIVRSAYSADYPDFRSLLNIPLIGANTFVLILSSFFVVRAVEAARQARQPAVLSNLVIVMALGSLFVAGQAYEWSTLLGAGLQLASTFGGPFFIVTGIHGTHVLVGLAWAGAVLFSALGQPNGRRDQSVEMFGLYWHFVDIVWIVLFSVIYLL